MNTPSIEERLDLTKLTDAYERNGLMGVRELALSALSQARQEGREEAVDYIHSQPKDREVNTGRIILDPRVLEEAITIQGK